MTIEQRFVAKRIIDTVLILLLSPFIAVLAAITAVAVTLNLGRPIIYTQNRTGVGGQEFKIYKFRSMLPEISKDGVPLSPPMRLTAFGRLLRKSSLDELPQLWNVLKGDMSLVGPRPLLPEYLPYYSTEEAIRHRMRPGITGLSQTSGRNALTWEERLSLDVEYVTKGTIWTDALIVFATLRGVIKREGVDSDPSTTGEYLSVHRSYPRKAGLTLRRFEYRDVPTRVAWFNDSRVSGSMSITTPIHEEGTREWLTRARTDPLRKDLVLYDMATGEPLALLGYKAQNPGGLATTYIAVSPDVQGRGLGTAGLELLLQYMHGKPEIGGARAEINADNSPSLALHEKCGFRRVAPSTNGQSRVVLEVAWSS